MYRPYPNWIPIQGTAVNVEALRERLWTALAALICEHHVEPCRACYSVVRNQVDVVAGALIVAAYGSLNKREDYSQAGAGVLHLLEVVKEG